MSHHNKHSLYLDDIFVVTSLIYNQINKNSMIIYKTVNLINGKIYVGQDKYNDSNYLGSGYILLKAIKKYGKNNFKKTILQFCNDKNELNVQEKYWIKRLDATNPSIGYNLVDGGQGGNLGEYANKKKSKTLKKFFKNNPGFHSGEKNANYNNETYHFYNIETCEEFKGTKFQLSKKTSSRSSAINSLIKNNKCLIHKNWILYKNKNFITKEYLKNKRIKNNVNYNNDKFIFEHTSGIVEINVTQNEMKKKYKLKALSQICTGKRNIQYGWKIKK